MVVDGLGESGRERFGEGSEEYLECRGTCILPEEAVESVGVVRISFSSYMENQKCINPEGKAGFI